MLPPSRPIKQKRVQQFRAFCHDCSNCLKAVTSETKSLLERIHACLSKLLQLDRRQNLLSPPHQRRRLRMPLVVVARLLAVAVEQRAAVAVVSS